MYSGRASQIIAGRRLAAEGESLSVAAAGSRLPETADVVVVGAGIIGLSIAWRLALSGQKVVVVDKGQVGSGASLAATGMLAAAAEYEAGGEILIAFALESQRRWEAFGAELEQASGLDIDFDRSGTIVVAMTRDETARLRGRFELHQKVGLESRWLTGAEVRDFEGGLRPTVTAGIHCPGDFQVDPRRVMPALEIAAKRAGVIIVENVDVTGLLTSAGAISGVASGDDECQAPLVVLTTGAYAGSGQLLPADLAIPVRPLRGQSVSMRSPANQPPLLRHVIWTEQVHMAPKSGGRLIVGATVEEVGFDANVTVGGLFALLDAARRALPSVEDVAVEAVWSGFRPTSEDDAPILGAAGLPGLLLAVGHHRNGILLAPATADAIAGWALGTQVAPSAQYLNLQRFGRRP